MSFFGLASFTIADETEVDAPKGEVVAVADVVAHFNALKFGGAPNTIGFPLRSLKAMLLKVCTPWKMQQTESVACCLLCECEKCLECFAACARPAFDCCADREVFPAKISHKRLKGEALLVLWTTIVAK